MTVGRSPSRRQRPQPIEKERTMRTEQAPKVNTVAAGAALAAAQERGASEEEQFKQALAAGMVADSLDRETKRRALARSESAPHTDRPEHHPAAKQPREGMLRKIAHWLNLM